MKKLKEEEVLPEPEKEKEKEKDRMIVISEKEDSDLEGEREEEEEEENKVVMADDSGGLSANKVAGQEEENSTTPFPEKDEEPNDRKISKLCEYASKTPLRIPKITSTLEQRCYKDLRTENFHSVKVVMCIYRKLLISFKDQMPLFASSPLSIAQILLDQTRHDEIRI
ncbi:protein SEMI-ROLLED LEAF 2-like [Rosa chinensis]|uniref:protein SEMI-ROLLED LEAF 2-like n=1 Tax=Rosa chinensis TaxID=74649 RepID=UPI001AD909EE|nr:protein SEMI-ROLLED LEAF 2-like [Rosa chinensis]XP_040368519.1 protein SEMI-ROLLED LEAF 2-like [Rosa chinensis]